MTTSPIMDIIQSETNTMIDTPILETMELGNLNRDNWGVWACQRYHAAHRFIPLLDAGIKGAHSAGERELQDALQHNLDDENGTNNPQIGSHEKWRQDFYSAMGVTQEQLNDSVLLPGTIEYRETLESLEQGNIHGIIGALLYLEFSIPHEFRRIQKGRDMTFSEKFVIQKGDGKEKKKQKGLARLYIDHHITHDADNHFPDLIKTIEPLLQNGGERQMIEGTRIIARAKRQFYDCMGYELGIAPNVRKSVCSNPNFMSISLGQLTHEMVNLWYNKALKMHVKYGTGEILSRVRIDGVKIERFEGYTFYSDIDGGEYGRYLRALGIKQPYYGIAFVTKKGVTHYHEKSDAFNLILSGSGIFIGETPNRKNGDPLEIGTDIQIPKNAIHGHSVIEGKELCFFAIQECGFDHESPCKGDFLIP